MQLPLLSMKFLFSSASRKPPFLDARMAHQLHSPTASGNVSASWEQCWILVVSFPGGARRCDSVVALATLRRRFDIVAQLLRCRVSLGCIFWYFWLVGLNYLFFLKLCKKPTLNNRINKKINLQNQKNMILNNLYIFCNRKNLFKVWVYVYSYDRLSWSIIP